MRLSGCAWLQDLLPPRLPDGASSARDLDLPYILGVCVLREDMQMNLGPKLKDRRHRSYSEGADEPSGLIDSEATEIETEHPSDDTEPMEQVQDEETVRPMFEE